MKKRPTTPKEITLKSGNKIFLGRNEASNDELMKKFKGKENTILHTVSPGSPFGVIEKKASEKDIQESGAIVAGKSQAWRENKTDIKLNVFTGKDISKPWFSKAGSWNVKNSKIINIKKEYIQKWQE